MLCQQYRTIPSLFELCCRISKRNHKDSSNLMNSFPTPMLCCGSSMGKKKRGEKFSSAINKERKNSIKSKQKRRKWRARRKEISLNCNNDATKIARAAIKERGRSRVVGIPQQPSPHLIVQSMRANEFEKLFNQGKGIVESFLFSSTLLPLSPPLPIPHRWAALWQKFRVLAHLRWKSWKLGL